MFQSQAHFSKSNKVVQLAGSKAYLERGRSSDLLYLIHTIVSAMSSAGARLKCVSAQASKSARKVPTRSPGSQPQRVSLEVRSSVVSHPAAEAGWCRSLSRGLSRIAQ